MVATCSAAAAEASHFILTVCGHQYVNTSAHTSILLCQSTISPSADSDAVIEMSKTEIKLEKLN